MPKTLIHIVSGQTMPTLIAHKIFNPEINALMFTPATENEFKKTANAIGGNIDQILVKGFELNNITENLKNYVENYCNKGDEIIFNFTGGTKIQSVAMFQFAMDRTFKAVYLNSQNNEVIIFYGGEEIKRENYNVKISPEEFFAINGYKISEYSTRLNLDAPSKSYLEVMKKNYAKFYKFIKGDIKEQKKIQLRGSKKIFYNKNTRLRLVYNNTIYLDINTYSAVFRNTVSSGIWLEYLSFSIIKNSGKFDDVKLNVKLPFLNKEQESTSKNEIDVFALKGITPYMFECKTAEIKKAEIDKLNYLRRIYLGRYAKIYFITVASPKTTIKEKISDNNIEVILFKELKSFIDKINFTENPALK